MFKYLPVNRCGNLLLCCELQRVNNTEQLIKIPSCGGRVKDGQLEPLIRANHKDLKRINGITLNLCIILIFMYTKYK